MRQLIYQLKNIRRDKLCIMTFFLPVIVGLAINLISENLFSSAAENSFGILKEDLPAEIVEWLKLNGAVTVFDKKDMLDTAVMEPSTQMIGVLQSGNGIKTFRSGDELKINALIADTLPQLYKERQSASSAAVYMIPSERSYDALKPLLIVITLVTALFMGCTFNAMSMIGEKEDGVVYINEILPLGRSQYILQKMFLGFSGSVISTFVTALVCMKIGTVQVLALILLIVLSAFIASLTGIFIGRLSNGLMTGISCIKLFMLLYIVPPVLIYLLAPADSLIHTISFLLPSCVTFYVLMEMLNGQIHNMAGVLLMLAGHCLIWFVLLVGISKRFNVQSS